MKIAIAALVAALAVGVTAAPADARPAPSPQRADTGWGCGGAC